VVAPLVFSKPDNLRAQLVESGFLVPILILLPFLAAFVLILVRGSGHDRLLGISVAAISGGLYAGCVVLNNFGALEFARFSHSDWAATTAIFNVRYGVAAEFFLAALIPIAANLLQNSPRTNPKPQQPVKAPNTSQNEPPPPTLLPGRARALTTQVASWTMLTVLTGTLLTAGQFSEKPRRANTDQWHPAATQAENTCHTKNHPHTITLPAAPQWKVHLTCTNIQQHTH